MSRPVDLPTTFEHGTRACYVSQRCRCKPCRKANAAYARQRAHAGLEAAQSLIANGTEPRRKRCACGAKLRADSTGNICNRCRPKLAYNGTVDATPIRDHLTQLRAVGVGYRQVADAAGVSRTILQNVMSGRSNVIRAGSLRRVLEVDGQALADGASVPAGPSRALIRLLMEDDGFTRVQIAERAGLSLPTLYSKADAVLASTELRLRRLHNVIHHGENDDSYDAPTICSSCGVAHHRPRDRRALIAGKLPATAETIMARYPCIYGSDTNGSGYRKLMRDLASLRRDPNQS